MDIANARPTGEGMEDQVEAVEVLHKAGAEDLYFRFIGTARERQFILNVQFDAINHCTGENIRPAEHNLLIARIMRLVLDHLAGTTNSDLH